MKRFKRGELYDLAIDDAIGSEQQGFRPALILQNNQGNKHSKTVIVAMLTSQEKSEQPTHVELEGFGLDKPSTVLLEQIRTVDKRRFGAYIGKVNQVKMAEIDMALDISLGRVQLE